MLQTVSQQLKVNGAIWAQYAERAETRREHLLELQTSDSYLSERFTLLEKELQTVEYLASKEQLPDAAITETGLKITLLVNAVPEEAETLMRQAYSLLPKLYSNIYHLWVGSILTLQAIISGNKIKRPRRVNSDPCGQCKILNVRFFPFREVTPRSIETGLSFIMYSRIITIDDKTRVLSSIEGHIFYLV